MRRQRILVIDGSDANAQLAKIAIEDLGYEGAVALDGCVGLARAHHWRPDLILLGSVLPDIDSLELLRALKQGPELRDISVIFRSDHYDGCQQAEAIGGGASVFLPKNCKREVLLEHVAGALMALPDLIRMNKQRILIIDDDYSYAELAQLVLQSAGYEVETAFSARGGLVSAAARRPDLILVDIMMPDIDGFDAIRRLRSDPATRDIPVVICSGSRGRCALAKRRGHGAADCILKVLKRDEFLSRIARVLTLRSP